MGTRRWRDDNFIFIYKTKRLPYQNKNDLLSTLGRNRKSFDINVIKDSSL